MKWIPGVVCWKMNRFTTGIIISVWTIIQTVFHILWALSGYSFYVCKIKPTHYWLVMLYLTYFYNYECGDVTLDNDKIFIVKEVKRKAGEFDVNVTDENELYCVLETILEKAKLPTEADHALRTNLYLLIFIISDACWAISAFLLFAGTCFQVKKCLSLLLYCPWLTVTGFIILLDVTAAVHFGMDMLQINNYTSWLKFIGVENYKDFSKFNSFRSSSYVPVESSILLCTLFCRCFIFWITNIINFSQILNITLLSYQDYVDDDMLEDAARRKRRKAADSALNLNTSESRIRSWQLFYGAIETTSTVSGSSSKSSKSSERDCNSNNRPKRNSVRINPYPKPVDVSKADLYYEYISTIRSNFNETSNNPGPHNLQFIDVADGLENMNTSKHRKGSTDSLRGQLPWSYTNSLGESSNIRELAFNISDNPGKDRKRRNSFESKTETNSTSF